MTSWQVSPIYTVDLDCPLERRFESFDRDIVARAKDLLQTIQAQMPPSAVRLARLLNLRTWWRFSTEAKAIARQGGLDWRWLMVANVSYDLAVAHLGCSTAILPTPHGPVIARNMDWWPEDKLAAASCLIRCTRGDKLQFAIAGWPGSIGVVTGLSERGFALVLNAVSSTEPAASTGYPVLLFLRKVLQDAPDFDQAVQMITGQRLCVGALVTVAGTTNDQRVVIERTPTRAALRWGLQGQPLIATNHYRLIDQPVPTGDDLEIPIRVGLPCGRYDALARLASQLPPAGRTDTPALLYALTDQDVMQTITAQHVILQPAEQRIELFVPRRLLSASLPSPQTPSQATNPSSSY